VRCGRADRRPSDGDEHVRWELGLVLPVRGQ
jgi:hypothetical protein